MSNQDFKEIYQSKKQEIINCLDFFANMDNQNHIQEVINTLNQIYDFSNEFCNFLSKKKQELENYYKVNNLNQNTSDEPKENFPRDDKAQIQIELQQQEVPKINRKIQKRFNIKGKKTRLAYDQKNDLWREFYSLKEGRYFCSKCNQLFQRTQILFNHTKQKHYNQDKFGCKLCKRQYYSMVQLFLHHKYDHCSSEQGLSYRICEFCSQISTITAVKQHVETLHFKEVPFKELLIVLTEILKIRPNFLQMQKLNMTSQ